MNIFKKLCMATILLTMGIVCVPVMTSAKSVSKVTKVITITSKKGIEHSLSINPKEKVSVKVKFLSVKGKVKVQPKDLYFGFYEFAVYQKKKMIDGGEGSFYNQYTTPKLTKGSFKKGRMLSENKEDYISGKSTVEWSVPNKIKKIKMQITYFTRSGRKGINSIKTK